MRDLKPEAEKVTMADDRMALIELVEKQAHGDLFGEKRAFAAERIMESDRKAIDPGDRL